MEVRKWRARYGGMDASLMAWLKELEDENQRLKKFYAEERLKAEILTVVLAKDEGPLNTVRGPSRTRASALTNIGPLKSGGLPVIPT